MKKQTAKFPLESIPEFERLRNANPQNPSLDALQAIIMYGRAIHWVAILGILWPEFEETDYLRIEAGYLTVNDPDDSGLPSSLHPYLASMITMFWDLQLRTHHPDWKWNITIDDDPEITVEVQILDRGQSA